MRLFLAFWGALLLTPLPATAADAVWILKSGPVAVPSIPLDPVQMVSAWRGQYSDGAETVWIYATRSPQFFPPRRPEVRPLEGTPWTAVFFTPAWKPEQRREWIDRWTKEFLALFSLPDPGYPIVFPSVLRKD